jgi:hypothetical protein
MEEMVMTGFKTKGLAEPIASFLIACLLAYGSLPGAAKAASDSSSTDSSTPAKAWLKQVPELIAKGEIKKALDKLAEDSQATDADWHNLMGFGYRKQTPPDFGRSEFHYLEALKIKPDHRGALEYYGELMLMKNDLAGAQEMAKRLKKACFFGCEELRDLQKAIDSFKPR